MALTNQKSGEQYDSHDITTPLLATTDVTSDDSSFNAYGHAETGQDIQGNNLGTFRGVYVPCVLSIFGVVLFLRLGWSVGHVGLFQTLYIMLIAGVVDVFTILSVSAISTTGRIKGGGPYYLISRSLGPAFGASAGLAFFIANAISVTFYLTGFVEVAMSSWGLNFASKYWMDFVVGSGILLIVTTVALVGAKAYSYLASIILLFKLISIIVGFLSFMIRDYTSVAGTSIAGGFFGLHNASDNLYSNLYPLNTSIPNVWVNHTSGPVPEGGDVTGEVGFFQAFAVLFPAFTGIMAGCNMSGDLANPGKSIYQGSLSGMGTAVLVYLALIFAQACTTAQGLLAADPSIMEEVAWRGWLVSTGIFCSTFASAMASVVGAARILQALARDKLIRPLNIFSYGSPKNDEPRIAIFATWLIAQLTLFVGELNSIAPILSMCFLLTYTIINFAVFVLSISGTPNFRPSFKWYSWHTALLGALFSVTVMFLLNALIAGIFILIMMAVFVCITYFGRDAEWGEVSQALIYHQVRKYLLRLDVRKEHVKNWRPGVLMILEHSDTEDVDTNNLIIFANELKKGGLLVLGKVMDDEGLQERSFETRQQVSEACRRVKLDWLSKIDELNVKAFVEVITSPTQRDGVFNLMQTAGLGGLTPNTLLLPFNNNVIGNEKAEISYLSMVRDAQALSKNVVLARGFEHLQRCNIKASLGRYATIKGKSRKTIDVWPLECWGVDVVTETFNQSALLLQLANIVHSVPFWGYHSSLRVCTFVVSDCEIEVEKVRLEQVLATYRIVAQVQIYSLETLGINPGLKRVETNENPPSSHLRRTTTMDGIADHYERAKLINQVMKQASNNTHFQFLSMPLPLPGKEEKHEQYTKMLAVLTDDLPPVALVLAEQAVITNEM